MRNLYIVAYDITDPQRWRKIYKIMRGYGTRIQYSVFYCYLSDKEKVLLIMEIDDIIDHKKDSIIIIKLGESDLDKKVEFIGENVDIKDHEAIIV